MHSKLNKIKPETRYNKPLYAFTTKERKKVEAALWGEMSKDDNDASMADNNNHNSEHEDESEGQGMQPGDEEDILLGGMPKIVVVSISSPLLSG